VTSGFKVFAHTEPFHCEITDNPAGGLLPGFELAYETWGELNADKTNAILLFTGLSASSHAKSHPDNTSPGWWEKFIGPGKALDTSKNYIICANVLGGCYGSSGPSSINTAAAAAAAAVVGDGREASWGEKEEKGGGDTQPRYGMTFPLLTISDMVRTQFLLLDHLGIHSLHAAVGSSMGGMLSLASAAMYPDRVRSLVSISSGCRSHPTAIALRYMQRRILMADPHWNAGDYYAGPHPVVGLKHARELATISYRSGPEWEERFGKRMAPKVPGSRRVSFLPDFLIETYLDHQGNQWCGTYDPNSLLYISKAMDLFDMVQTEIFPGCGEIGQVQCPALIMGVQSDILFPIQQQREVVDLLKASGNEHVSYYELNAKFGHDTFLIDVNGVTGAIRGHLS
jgi:homoserine O-acetyltransferase